MRRNLLSFIEDYAAKGAETVFACQRGLRIARWSGQRVAETAFKFARELEARRIGKGNRVLFWANNSPEWVASFFGCLLRGVIVVPLDPQSSREFAGRVRQQTEPKLMLSDNNPSRELDVNLPQIRLEELSDVLAPHQATPYRVEDIGGNDLIEIIYTSGTTGEPKGVCITHQNVIVNVGPIEQYVQKYLKWERFAHPIRFLNLLPLSHVFGQFMSLFVSPIIKGEVFFENSLNPSEIIDRVRRERISAIVTVPRLLDTLRNKFERGWASRGQADRFRKALDEADKKHLLRKWWVFRNVHSQFGWKFWAFVSGGATLNPETEAFWRRLGFLVVQGYGMTETASLISFNDPFKTAAGSIGTMLPGLDVKLDESGEILVRGGNISPGYWREVITPLADEEGWLHTGDLGEIDEAGKLYFKGRKKDVIATAAGLKIYPEDIEAALNSQPEVRDSAVIGVEGPIGPEPLAVILLRDPQSDVGAVIKRANEKLTDYQHIRRWHVWPEADFPRTTLHKVRKRDVAEAIEAQVTSAVRVQTQPTALAEIVARASGKMTGPIEPSTELATDLKLDSLGRVELLSALEDHYQIELDEAAFTAATTLRDVEKLLQESAPEPVRDYPYPEWPQRFPANLVRFIVLYLLIFPIARLMSRVRVCGKERLEDVHDPAMFVSNHITAIDPALILLALPGRFRRRVAIAMIGELLRDWRYPSAGTNWILRLFWRVVYDLVVCLFNVFPLPQESGFRRSFAFAGYSMDRGYNLLVFPEGQRTKDGRMNPFLGGIGILASGLSAKIIPVKIEGLFELKQKRRYFAAPGQITVTFGEPLSYSPAEKSEDITKDLEIRVAKL